MRTVWRIYRRDLRRAFGSLAMVVLTIALAVIPGLYAWFNIAAAMDPYGHTDRLSVAVANNDRTATLTLGGKTTKLNAGDSIITELKKNHQLGWTFVSRDEALRRVKSGESYAAIVIPKDFSSTLVDLAHFSDPDAKLEHPRLHYYVNEKISAVAPKITDTGANTLDQTINETVVKTASKAVVGQLRKSAGSLMDQAGSTVDSSARAVSDAAAGLGDVRTSLDDLSGTLTQAADATGRAKTRLASLTTQADGISSGIDRASGKIPALRSSAVALSSKLPAAIGTATSALTQATSAATGVSDSATTALSGAVSRTGSALTQADTALKKTKTTIDDLKNLESQLRQQGQTQAADALANVVDELEGHESRTQSLVDSLTASNTQAQTTITDLRRLTDELGATADGAAATTDSLASQAASAGSTTALDALGSAQSAAQAAKDGLSTLSTAAGRAQDTLTRLRSTLTSLSSTMQSTGGQLAGVQKSLTTTATDIAAITSSQNAAQLRRLLRFNSTSVADFISSPTQITTKVVFPVAKYGSALTPLYSNVALWMGSLMLVIVIRMEVDTEGLGTRRLRHWQAYLGRYLLIGTVAMAQGLVITAGDLATGIDVLNIPAFLFAGMAQGLVYSSIIYALTVCFQHIGKSLAILLIIMQIPGATGIYPIEMMPKFYQDLNPWLPWTYGISMMREAIGGMYRLTYGHDLLILLVFSACAFLIGLWLRPHMVNLNLLMDERLAQTEFFGTESGEDLQRPRVRLTTIVRSLIGTPAWRERVLRRAVAFDKAYPRLIRAAFIITALVPFIPFALIASPNEKLVSMGIWVVVMLVAVVFVIVIEYVHRSLTREVGLSRLSAKDLQDLMSAKEEDR